eukprot:1438596-Amphidinium_carterae.2
MRHDVSVQSVFLNRNYQDDYHNKYQDNYQDSYQDHYQGYYQDSYQDYYQDDTGGAKHMLESVWSAATVPQ